MYNPECTDHITGANKDTVMMVATHVVALFPSLGIEETARDCGQMVETSNLEVENIDYRHHYLTYEDEYIL